MTTIAVISPKGGVGKTTVAVNLAFCLAAKGRAVKLVDLDPQNSLRLHLGDDPGAADGLAHQTLLHRSWHEVESETAYGVSFIPYGKVSEVQRIALEAHLACTPNWLRENLARLGPEPGGLTIIDTSSGPSGYVQQALLVADMVLVVMLPDAGCYATLKAVESMLEYYCGNRTDFYGAYYVLNQFDAAQPLSRDMTAIMQNELGERAAPCCIHRDESMSEALAFQQPVSRYAPHSQCVDDIEQLADWLHNLLEQVQA